MAARAAISVEHLTKEYRIYPGSFARVKEGLTFGRKLFHKKYRALDDVSFEIPHGKALGIIGENGAGKSTLLKLLAGTSLPTSGRFEIDGAVASLLELGTGFHSEFTGRDNIFLSAQVLGFKIADIEQKLDSIIEFAELGEYIDRPIRTYSSGMVMRLGFSVATAIDPEVLIIDEILAVGDLYFQKKCIDRIFDFRARGKSILFCSHSLYDVRQICDEVVWIKNGKVAMRGPPEDVTVAYANHERALTGETDEDGKHLGPKAPGLPAITSLKLLRADDGTTLDDPIEPGVDVVLQIDFVVRDPGHELHLAAAVYRNDNILVTSFKSTGTSLPSVPEPGHWRCQLRLPALALLEGEYNVVGYLLDETGVHFYDHRQVDRPLLVRQELDQPGVVRLPHAFELLSLDPRT